MAEDWSRMVPDAPERMIRMAEKEQDHRHWIDRRYVLYRFVGQITRALLGAVGLVGGLLLIASGHDGYGLAAFVSALAILAGVFALRQLTFGYVPRSGNGSGS